MKRLILVVSFLLAVVALKAQISFTSVETLVEKHSVGSSYSDLDIQYGDFNDDDNPDMLFISGPGLFIKLGQGDGTFGEDQQVFSFEQDLVSMSELADADADGDFDLAVTVNDQLILLEWGNDEFTETNRTAFSRESSRLKWLDYDRNGSLDLVATTSDNLVVNARWRTDFNDFRSILDQTDLRPYNFWFFDIDKDGLDDLALANSHDLRVYLQEGPGNWVQRYMSEETTVTLELGDINMDGYTDMVYAESNEIYALYYNEQTNGFQLVHETEETPQVNLSRLALVDLDKNGTLEVVFTDQQRRLAYLDNQDGVLSEPKALTENKTGGIHSHFFVHDLDKNGFQDLSIHHSAQLDIVLMDESFTVKSHLISALRYRTEDVELTDLDGDGNNDIIMTHRHGVIEVLWGATENAYSTGTENAVPKYVEKVVVMDMDEDGLNDLLFSVEIPGIIPNELYLMRGIGQRAFDEPYIWRQIPDPSRPFLMDIDNDGSSEIVSYSRAFGTVAWFSRDLNDEIEYYRTGTTLRPDLVSPFIGHAQGDFNEDGFADLALISPISNRLLILLNDQDGGFIQEATILPRDLSGIASFDFNFDDTLDLLIVTQEAGQEQMEVYLGDGSGGFSLDVSFPLRTFSGRHIEIADIDIDGDQDIMVHSWDYNSSNTFEQVDGVFRDYGVDQPDVTSLGQAVRAYGHLNDDNKIDAVTVTLLEQNVYTQLNNSAVNPDLEGFEVTTGASYDWVVLNVDRPNSHGSFFIMEEGADQTLEQLPVDGEYYSPISEFGAGGEISGGYAVYIGEAHSILVEGVKPLTDYTIYAFALNTNRPDNYMVNYSDEYIQLSVTTPTSIELIKEFEALSLNEDESITLDLSAYVMVGGDAGYQISMDNSDVKASVSDGMLTITGTNHFFGMVAASLTASNDWESREYSFSVNFEPVNDPPDISSIDLIDTDIETVLVPIDISDQETAFDDLVISFQSSNGAVLPQGNIALINERTGKKLRLEPVELGQTMVTVSVSDGELTSEMEFELNVAEITSLDPERIHNRVRVFPNPGSTEVQLLTNNRQRSIRLYDLNGNMVSQHESIPELLSIRSLESGMYLLKVDDQVIRLIKQ